MRTTLNFLLYDWLRVETLCERQRFEDHSRATFEAVLDTSERIARDRFAPFNRLVDSEEPQFDGERVRLPAATQAAVSAYAESGLLAAGHDYEYGGMQLPYVIDMAANSFFSKASIGLSAYAMLTYANGNLLMAYGTPAQRKAFAEPGMVGRSMGTMCLSEPQAGSSLGDILTKAVPDGVDFAIDPLGPRYRLSGSKMWISGGDHELSENIIHLVLAKIPCADGKLPDGVGGISLFVVPRKLVDAEGKLSGERNDVALAGLNHKLGYRGTVNTLLNFGEGRYPVRSGEMAEAKAGALGYLVGEPGQGLHCMFHMMNEARINVGMGATMLGYAGYLASLDYARNRPQGRLQSTRSSDVPVPQVRIIEHADVKRMLLAQKSYVEGGLALGLYCAHLIDERNTGDVDSAQQADTLLGILTPVAKSWPSEWCLEANNLAIQVHGGYGYTRDFQVEQYWRDNRLNMIHEGTHGIQGRDLLGRKVLAGDGYALHVWRNRVEAAIEAARPLRELNELASTMNSALDRLMVATRNAWSWGNAHETLANATPYLQAFGHTVIAWIWLQVAAAAVRDMHGSGTLGSDFYLGKLQAARYFFRHELPKTEAWLHVVAQRDLTALDMQDAWF
ncbi:acyl-CoA dehydrogenase [Paraburkholderia sp. GAS32]|uniref:acyl-CoA dehydrogenase n=1 Tax=Paraburkholderia sp. GAS32 TaxID=3035129 RepID=UPI003D22AC9A